MSSEMPLKPTLVRPRIYLGERIAIGPGKIDLLRQVAETRSISAAARAMGMTYKRAWLLIDSLNQGFGQPVVEASAGGKGGGGAQLTALGQSLVLRYGALENALNSAGARELDELRALIDTAIASDRTGVIS
jgi:molybdate transport system regulatory protein